MTSWIGSAWRRIALAAAAASLGTTVAAQGDVLYGIRGDLLFRIDTTTLEGVEIGHTGVGQIGGLAFASDGTLYGVVAGSGLLVSIDPDTASATVIGPLGLPITIHGGLAHDPASDRLYALGSGTGVGSMLLQVSMETGEAVAVGDTHASALVGLAADGQGMLYGLDGAPGKEHVVRIDPETAALEVLAPSALKPFPSTGALDVGSNGRLWTVNSQGSSYELVEVDVESGLPSSLGLIQGMIGPGAINGLASLPAVGGLKLFPPSPGVTGKLNTVVVTGATPGSRVALIFGFYPGVSRLPWCRGKIGILAPVPLRARAADKDGVAEFKVFVHPGLEGIPFLLQALELGACESTDVLTVTF